MANYTSRIIAVPMFAADAEPVLDLVRTNLRAIEVKEASEVRLHGCAASDVQIEIIAVGAARHTVIEQLIRSIATYKQLCV